MRFSILDPTGNVTALVTEAVTPVSQPSVASRIMARHIEVEQVGFVRLAGDEGELPTLRMAGGEFCGNATMSAAAWVALADPTVVRDGHAELALAVSGATEPVAVRLTQTSDDSFTGAVRMPRPLTCTEVALSAQGTTAPTPLVTLAGITHAIVDDSHPFFSLVHSPHAAEDACRAWCADLGADGLGIMFWDRTSGTDTLTPLVFVPGAGTVFWERSCASGTSAVGMWEAERTGRTVSLALAEPGGVLRVTSAPRGDTWLEGTVRLVQALDEDL